jgi:hypothetical protein
MMRERVKELTGISMGEVIVCLLQKRRQIGIDKD